MDKVYQKKNNDCFSACLATLLGMNLEDVPNFFEAGQDKNWSDIFRQDVIPWVRTLGWDLWHYNPDKWPDWQESIGNQFFIATHRSPSLTVHAVVMQGSKLYHDPAKGNELSVNLHGMYFLLPLNPFSAIKGKADG